MVLIDEPRPVRQRIGSVLFACTHNAVRSPIAEGLLRHGCRPGLYVESVGVQGCVVDPFAVAVMAEVGIDIGAHQPKSFDTLEDSYFDLVITLSLPAQRCAAKLVWATACELEHWVIPEPASADGHRDAQLDAYRQIRDQLRQRIRQRFGLRLR